MRDDDGRACVRLQPRLEPFQCVDVQVVGGLVEQQEAGPPDKQSHQAESGLLPAAQLADWCAEREVAKLKAGQGGFELVVGHL